MEFIRRHQKKIMILSFLACVGIILFLSGQNGSQAFWLTYRLSCPIAEIFYDNPNYDQILAVMILMRKIGRCVAFGVFGAMVLMVSDVLWGKKKGWRILIPASMVIVAFSVFDETRKLMIEGRHCTWQEIAINIVCGFAGCIIVYGIKRRKEQRSSHKVA